MWNFFFFFPFVWRTLPILRYPVDGMQLFFFFGDTRGTRCKERGMEEENGRSDEKCQASHWENATTDTQNDSKELVVCLGDSLFLKYLLLLLLLKGRQRDGRTVGKTDPKMICVSLISRLWYTFLLYILLFNSRWWLSLLSFFLYCAMGLTETAPYLGTRHTLQATTRIEEKLFPREREGGRKKRRAKAPAATTGQKPTHYHLPPNFFLYCVIFPPNI